MIYKNIMELKDIHKGEDIWILNAGSSMNFVDNSFFDNKITIGVNQIYRLFRCNYAVMKDLGESDRFDESIVELKDSNTKLLFSRYHAGNYNPSPGTAMRSDGKNTPEYSDNFYVFDHGNNGSYKKPDGSLDLDVIGSEDKIIAIRSTFTSALHLAAYFGAKNIMVCGVDSGKIDGKSYMDNYTQKHWTSGANNPGTEQWLGGIQCLNLEIRDRIKDVYNCNIHSLNPFLNFKLDGHRYDSF